MTANRKGIDKILEERRAEQAGLVDVANEYVEQLSGRVPLIAAALVGSGARGDFNVWSDIDVIVIADDLPERFLDRAELLSFRAPPRVQPVGFTRQEFETALEKRNAMAWEAIQKGIVLVGDRFFEQFATPVA